jgi:tetratricopeptide (TPR) repeat protein
MRNPNPIIFLIVALAFLLGAGIFKGFFFPVLILFFAYQYSKRKSPSDNPDPNSPRNRRRYDPRNRRSNTDYERRREYQAPAPKATPRPVTRKRPNPYKKSGVEKYKEYDYDGAIEDFKKALEIDPNDIPTHFNIACAYSLTEEDEKAFYHLDKAVENGYKDFNKIQSHDAFAFIRIQEEFEEFAKNNYRLTEKQKTNVEEEDFSDPDLLEKLKKLADLRDNGILTEEEFLTQKEKLLR